LLYELGLLYVRFTAKRQQESETEEGLPVPTYQAPTEADLDRELDQLEKIDGKKT